MPTFDSTPSVWSMRGVQVSAFFSACKYVEGRVLCLLKKGGGEKQKRKKK